MARLIPEGKPDRVSRLLDAFSNLVIADVLAIGLFLVKIGVDPCRVVINNLPVASFQDLIPSQPLEVRPECSLDAA